MAKEWGPDPDEVAQRRANRESGNRNARRGCAVIAVALLGAAVIAVRAAIEVFA